MTSLQNEKTKNPDKSSEEEDLMARSNKKVKNTHEQDEDGLHADMVTDHVVPNHQVLNTFSTSGAVMGNDNPQTEIPMASPEIKTQGAHTGRYENLHVI